MSRSNLLIDDVDCFAPPHFPARLLAMTVSFIFNDAFALIVAGRRSAKTPKKKTDSFTDLSKIRSRPAGDLLYAEIQAIKKENHFLDSLFSIYVAETRVEPVSSG